MANYPVQRENESAQAYEAARAYFEMGADRSQEAVSQKLGKSRQLLSRWSAQHDWTERARDYDAALSQEAAAAHTARYLADLEAHRKKASDAGAALYTVAGQLIKQINHAMSQPKYIEGKDGKRYQLHGVDLNAGTFAIAARAMQTALDLDAHSLGVDKVLSSLEETRD